ncbi:hypothetical protein QBC35DRAFT_447641 [Podospora australis]|uniref:Uncharacterized protein n=1 Tax=Podospora australis TaxID=1536484 RepID=A0AAN6X2U1_9PEZI|nr:hypothetical protein QBC35DRAFT_447641 [Podospora australis]
MRFPLTWASFLVLGVDTAHAIPLASLADFNTGNRGPNSRENPNVSLYRSPVLATKRPLVARNFDCSTLAYGLSYVDCEYMSSIGMFAQGLNPTSPNGRMWIGTEGPNTFTFINGAGVPVVLIIWYRKMSDNGASFMNTRQAEITYSLPDTGSAVEISVANGIPGGWSMLYNHTSTLSEYGQISNTFGEFSTGKWATVDVSRLVNMTGDSMIVRVYTGEPRLHPDIQPVCVTDMRTCVYSCRTEGVNMCGNAGSYELLNCGGPNGVRGIDSFGNPTGGCQGWSFGGHIEVIMI